MAIQNTILHGTQLKSNTIPVINDPKVIIPGRFENRMTKLSLNDDILSKHLMLIGGTGCGKTNTFYHMVSCLKKQMTKDDVMIIFDTKGDFYQKFYDANKDYVIGNSRTYRSQSVSWNVFKEITVNGYTEDNLEELYLFSREIAKGFFEGKQSQQQPFFVNAATEVLTAVLYQALWCNMYEPAEVKTQSLSNETLSRLFDLWEVSDFCRFISTNEKLKSTLALIGMPMVDDDGLYIFDNDGNPVFRSGDEAQNSVYTEILIAIRDILIGVFAQEGKFSVQKFVRQKGGHTLFIEYDLAMGSVLSPIYRMLIDLALKESLGREKSDGNVYLIIDELKLLPKLKHIQDAVNFGRSLGLKVIVGLQSITQLKEAYGDEAMNIIAGFSTVMSFHANDFQTREFTTQLYGKNIVVEQYINPDNTIKIDKRNGACVEDWEITKLDVGEAIVGLPFNPPFVFKFDMYKN